MNIIFQIEGGLGKSIMATAMVKAIKNRYKNANLIVATAYTDVFLNNPYIHETYNINQLNGLYLKYIKDQNCKILALEPYKTSDFITNKPISLLKTWCDLYGIKYNNEQPQIYLSQPEVDYFSPYYTTDKPIMVIQPNGGPAGLSHQYSWTRDIPTLVVKEIIDHYKEDYTIIHIKREDQLIYPDTLQALDSYRSIAILLQKSSKRLLIDSFSQHMARALNKPSTVCWVDTKPEIFGYKFHNNIQSNPYTKEIPLHSVAYNPFSLVEEICTIPYNNLNEIFDVNTIISSINNQ
jgi:ADP-heptose:LPS heptosyltransferase|tara:strand:+ start:4086 stop:4964 length:879 start_codon:yes stop_codon:yes gene_type:complete